MEDVKLKLNEKGRGSFYIAVGDEQLAMMEIGISENTLTAYHTEVSPKAGGKGLGKELLIAMAAYAREHKYKVIPLCPFVNAQFKRHPEEYSDIWLKPVP
ncbi:MAG TPA: GNAT family N-acetyltransferase [Puia sp.]